MGALRIYYSNLMDNGRFAREIEDPVGGPVRVRIGRGPENDIVLDSPFVATAAAVLNGDGSGWNFVALGRNRCLVDGEELSPGSSRPIKAGQAITIWPFSLTMDLMVEVEATETERRRALDIEASEAIRAIHIALLPRIRTFTDNHVVRHQADEVLLELERNLEDVAQRAGVLEGGSADLIDHMAGLCVRAEMLGSLLSVTGAGDGAVWEGSSHWSRLVSRVPQREDELGRVTLMISAHLGVRDGDPLGESIGRVEREFWEAWGAVAAGLDERFKQYLALRHLKKELKDIVFGYGPLEDLLRTPTISEIMVVDSDRIYIERGGVLENSGRRFVSDEVTLSIIERIVSRVGRRIDKSQPMVDARLSDGSRVNAVIPPLALGGPCLTIRKFTRQKLGFEELVESGSISRSAGEFLRAAVESRRNILVSGGTGSGKTTLLNCLSDFIPDRERIVTVEDTAELLLRKEHVVRLEVKDKNIEGAGGYSIRDLVRNALRMRPDRIVVGECRGPEALDMLQAMNTGHDGSLTTIHANSAEDVVLRMEVLVQMAADLPVASIHRQVASAIDLVIQLKRFRDGRRRVVQITEFAEVDTERGGIRTRDLFVFDEAAGELVPTGSLPTFMADLVESGKLRMETFYR
jgi:pilus assembly protein CpaF